MNRDAEKQVEAMNAALAVIVNHIGHITDNGAMNANLAAEQSSVANEISLNVANIREASRSITEEAESSAPATEKASSRWPFCYVAFGVLSRSGHTGCAECR